MVLWRKDNDGLRSGTVVDVRDLADFGGLDSAVAFLSIMLKEVDQRESSNYSKPCKDRKS